MRKQRKAKASLRKKKRQRAKNKRLREKGLSVPEIETSEAEPKKDSLKYRFRALQEDKYVIISFKRTSLERTDSVFVRYNSDEDDVLEYDKQILKAYVDSIGIEKIGLINIREHIGDTEEDRKHNRHASIVKEHTAQYFVKLGIPREKIKTISHTPKTKQKAG